MNILGNTLDLAFINFSPERVEFILEQIPLSDFFLIELKIEAEKSHQRKKSKEFLLRLLLRYHFSMKNWSAFSIHSFLTVTTTLVTECKVCIPYCILLYLLKDCRVVPRTRNIY